MIEDSVKIHDNFSLEIKSIYENISKRKKTKYDTITYLFIPNGLNINNQTYSNSKFYNDVKVYIRYNASEYELDEIINLKTGPLNLFIKSVKRILKEKSSKKNTLDFESKVKMLGAILNNSLKFKTEYLIRLSSKCHRRGLLHVYALVFIRGSMRFCPIHPHVNV